MRQQTTLSEPTHPTSIDRRIVVAPMMGCTDQHCRKLFRIISPNSYLFTEMVVSGALIYGDAEHFLRHSGDEPCALQIGGSNPADLARCATLAEAFGYQEVNLNVGCPSDRVQQGGIGACLMAQAELVGECVAAMQAACNIPVTVKCRIGIDDDDSFEFFEQFVKTVSEQGCEIFYVHARKAILSGLSPKENREIPPLKYDFVERIQAAYPHLLFILNGGISTTSEASEQLKTFPGVMMGRAPYKNPYLLAELEAEIFGYQSPSRADVVAAFVAYGRTQPDHPKHYLKHLLGLFTGCAGARHFRRHLSSNMFADDVSVDIITEAIKLSGVLDQTSTEASTQALVNHAGQQSVL